MNTSFDPLDNLRDIHLPDDPGFWPLAFGWWLVGFLSLLALVLLFFAIKRWYLRRVPLKEFKRQMLSIPLDNLDTDRERQTAVAAMSSSVRQLCVYLLGRETVASVSGSALLTLLDKLSASTAFSLGPGKILATGSYEPSIRGDLVELRHVVLEQLTKWSVLRNAKKITSYER